VQPTNQTPAQQIQTALTSPFAASGIELRLNALFGNEAKTGAFIRSLLHVDAKNLKFTDEPDGTRKAVFDILAVSFGENGIPIDKISKTYTLTLKKDAYEDFLRSGFVYNFVFPVKKPGGYQLRVALRDSGSARVGSANQFIEIPNLKKGFLTLSGILLENLSPKQFEEMQTQGRPAAKVAENSDVPRSSPQNDTSMRRFKRGTVLRYGFEIYNAKAENGQKPQLTTKVRVFRDGELVFEGNPAPVDLAGQSYLQKIHWVGALSLGTAMKPGDYVMQIIVTDNLAKEKRKIATQFVQFELVE
jgi:hypothetical protein